MKGVDLMKFFRSVGIVIGGIASLWAIGVAYNAGHDDGVKEANKDAYARGRQDGLIRAIDHMLAADLRMCDVTNKKES